MPQLIWPTFAARHVAGTVVGAEIHQRTTGSESVLLQRPASAAVQNTDRKHQKQVIPQGAGRNRRVYQEVPIRRWGQRTGGVGGYCGVKAWAGRGYELRGARHAGPSRPLGRRLLSGLAGGRSGPRRVTADLQLQRNSAVVLRKGYREVTAAGGGSSDKCGGRGGEGGLRCGPGCDRSRVQVFGQRNGKTEEEDEMPSSGPDRLRSPTSHR